MKLPEKQINALKWIAEREAQGAPLLLPHTWNYYEQWQAHNTSIQSFHAVERKGLAERRNQWFWHLTEDGKQLLATLTLPLP